MNASWDYVLKFIITGDASVGKSSLLVRLTDQRFLAHSDPTLGVEFGSKLVTIPEKNKTVKLQCWDTAGTESFRSITRSYYRGAAGCLLVYDVTSHRSFANARTWLADVRAHADPHLTCILVGNKVDLCPDSIGTVVDASQSTLSLSTSPGSISSSPSKRKSKSKIGLARREVSTDEAAAWAESEGLLFVEASAKSGENVEEAFVRAARDILDKIERGLFSDDERSPGVKLSRSNEGKLANLAGSRQSCC